MKTFRLSLIALSLYPLPSIGDDLGAEVQTSAAPKTPAIKTITNFTQSLRCMDELFYAYGKQGIAITSAGIPDETGKVKTGTKEMLITAKTGPTTSAMSYAPPAIEARIEYYKRLRETAAANGSAIPKVTSVLTLNEMAATGIFKTPRGYAAMVEATPIKLSYTIYPGEMFFDGQLVAVEENRLVFRKVTKTGEGKFVASVENKPLKQYSMKAQVEGTAPAQGDRPAEVASSQPVTASDKAIKPTSNPFLSPLDEMNNQPVKTETDKPKKGTKKPVKVAKNDGQ